MAALDSSSETLFRTEGPQIPIWGGLPPGLPTDEEAETTPPIDGGMLESKPPREMEDPATWHHNYRAAECVDLAAIGVPYEGAKRRRAADILKFIRELIVEKKHAAMSVTARGVPLLVALAGAAGKGSPLMPELVKLHLTHCTPEERASGAYTTALYNIWNLSRATSFADAHDYRETILACRNELLACDEGRWGPLLR